jgi:hypothetical protein
MCVADWIKQHIAGALIRIGTWLIHLAAVILGEAEANG